MKHAQPTHQRGITFIGLLFWGILLAFLAVVGAQVVPTVTEYMSINRAVKQAAGDGTTAQAVRESFDKRAMADYIDSISGKDLSITKLNDKVVVNFAYDKEIHLFGPAYLVLKYRGTSGGVMQMP